MTDLTALMVVNLLIWGGLFAYLMRIDAKVRRLEAELEVQ
jgi:CcmD family protein